MQDYTKQTMGTPKNEAKPKFIDGIDCEIPAEDRTLTMPDGQVVQYPLDMWPPVPGQECRPHVLRSVGAEVEWVSTTSGYMGAFYPSGMLTLAQQRISDADVKKLHPEYIPAPQQRPFAEQLGE